MKARLCVVAAIGLLVTAFGCGKGGGAESGAAVSPAVAAMLPDDAILAIVAYPKRVLQMAPHLKPLLGDMQADIGIAPADVEQVIGIFGFEPPGSHAPDARPFESAMIVRLAAPHGGDKFVADFLAPAKPEKVAVGERSFYHPAKDGPRPPLGRPHCLYLLDEHTFIAGDEADVRAMLAVKDVKTPLAKLLGSIDAANDLTLALANNDALAKMADEAKKEGGLPPPLMPFGDLPGQVTSALLTVKTAPEVSLKLAVEAKDAAAAEKIAASISPAKQMLAAMATALHGSASAKGSGEEKDLLDFALGKLDKIVAGLTPQQDGNQVTIQIDSLGTVDDWAAKAAPQITRARDASRRMMALNNLKQLALAMQAHLSDMGAFPARAILAKDGKPLLSWRVALLKYVDAGDLYAQFHLDEPWDSEHNKPLIAKMPSVFADSRGKSASEGLTRYVVPTGKDTVFDGERACRIEDIPDGMSNTLLIIEVGAEKAVTWTKPDDLEFDPQHPSAGLGTISDDGFAAAFCDGSVRRISKTIDAETLRRLIIRNDGQPIDSTKF